jgi:hypothetical protein
MVIPQFAPRLFSAIQCHPYARLTTVVISQQTFTNCMPTLNAYNPELYKDNGLSAVIFVQQEVPKDFCKKSS